MVELVYHGHSFVEIKGQIGSLLIDPFVEGNTTCELTVDEVIDLQPRAIIITHGHADHIGQTVEIAKATDCELISTYEVVQRLQAQGVEQTSAQHIGGSVDYEGFVCKFTPALHGGALPDGTICGVAAGVLVRLDGVTIYHAGDTGLSQEMKLLGEYEQIDLACLPIGDRFTMGIDDAVKATGFVQPRIVVPIHFGTWPLIEVDPMEFARRVMLEGVATPKVLKPGQLVALQATDPAE